jgi:hypothetical protein
MTLHDASLYFATRVGTIELQRFNAKEQKVQNFHIPVNITKAKIDHYLKAKLHK